MKNLLKFLTAIFILIGSKSSLALDLGSKYEKLNNIDYFLLIDRDSGEVLLEKNSLERIAPSSMTKLMTAYVVFDEIKKGRIKLNNQCLIGRDAWRKTGSSMFLNYGDIVSIDELIGGLIVVSGNDSAIALAQSISGSIKSFARLMNETAERIGLKNSHFKNPHGLNEDGHYMTLADLAIVTTRIAKDFPEFMHYFSTKEFSYRGITQKNRNPLIKNNYYGATGMKTGYTSEGGYGIVGSATRGNRNLIAITNNALSAKQREEAITELLDYGFENFEKIVFFSQDEVISKANVWLGQQNQVDLVSNYEVAISIPIDQNINDVSFEATYKDPIYAPIEKGQRIGELIIKMDDEIARRIPLYAKESVGKASYLSRMWRVFKYKVDNIISDFSKK